MVTIRDSQSREVQREEYETDLGQERLVSNTKTNPDTGETELTIYYQDPGGGFTRTEVLAHAAGDGPKAHVIVDVDTDGDPDIATVNGLSADVTVFFGRH